MNRKQAISLALRIGLSIVMLAVLIWRVPSFDLAEVVPEMSVHTVLWLTIAAALTLAALVLSALRWQRVLEVLGLHAGLRHLLSHYLACQFVSNVLPTTIGGDVLRVSRLSRETGESPKTFASVVLERLTGWLVLPIISVAGFLVNPRLQHLGTATRVALGLAFATLLALCVLLYAVADQRIGGRFAAKEGWRRFAGAVHLGLDRLRRQPRAAADLLLVGF
ncbi:MAG: lysylphosphatidylglycerol synthase transmembrane domain-containing protein, partial [Acidimicrobiales bacterium]